MANENENADGGRKRKKKRSRVQMAKKLARRRSNGGDVDSDTYQYMVRVLELMRNDFPTAEEKLMFVNNVYEQTVGHEVEYARNQVGSRILDSLLRYANLETIRRLADALKPSLRLLSSDRFASHVIQKIVAVCSDRGNRRTEDASSAPGDEESVDARVEAKESEVSAYNDIALNLAKYVANNMEEFVFDPYANHLLRTVVECLGGLIPEGGDRDKKRPGLNERRPVSREYEALLARTCNRLYAWPRFPEFGRDELSSGLLQSVLHSLKDPFPETAKAYVGKITSECFQPGAEQQASNAFAAECSARLLEACLAVADPESWRGIYRAYFAGNLRSLAVARETNFSVQRLLDHCAAKEIFEEIFDELSPCFADVLEKGYTGVVVGTANACLRLRTRQAAFVTELLKALGCEGKEDRQRIMGCVASLKRVEQGTASGTTIGLHGSLTAQAILNFNKPIRLVASILETDGDELARAFEDPRGSRIADAFMDSEYIGEKSRERLGKKLQGHWARLALTTHGSRVLERMWRWARTSQRTAIMEELAAAGESLRATKPGRIVSSKLNVALFARNRKDWTEALGKEERTRALFATIIGGATESEEARKR